MTGSIENRTDDWITRIKHRLGSIEDSENEQAIIRLIVGLVWLSYLMASQWFIAPVNPEAISAVFLSVYLV